MIKSFKDFDEELKGQKIYEEVQEVNKNALFTEEDIKSPKLLSSDKFFVKISKIIFKKLKNANLGNFAIHPTIVTINGENGVYFYNCENPNINIIICRNNYSDKQAYFYKNFNIDGENIADLVLTTKKLGFSDIIDELINIIKSNTIEEGLILEWQEEPYKSVVYTDADVTIASQMDKDTRQSIVDYVKDFKKASNIFDAVWNDYNNKVKNALDILDEIKNTFGKTKTGFKDITKNGYHRKVLLMFYMAIKGGSQFQNDLKILLDDLNTGNNNPNNNNNDINIDQQQQTQNTTDEDTIEKDPKFQAKIDANIKEYKRNLKKMTNTLTAMCKYIKNHGELDQDYKSVFSRGLLVTGNGGAAKSRTIKNILEENKMVENSDYFRPGSGSTSAGELYRLLYQYNGKLLIFDDSADIFEGKYNLPLWKLALDPDDYNNTITSNRPNDTEFYDPINKRTRVNLTRQEKYYLEVGKSSTLEKTKFYKKRKLELEAKYDWSKMDPNDEVITRENIGKIIDKEWNDHEEQKEPKIPSSFKYNGLVVIISNESREGLKDSMGERHWGAIKDRMEDVELSPMPEALWETIKETILEQTDNPELIDAQRLIPIRFVDEFIKEVELLLKKPQYRLMTWRIVAKKMHKAFQGALGIENWKEELRDCMNINH
jgi:hypothetical protein